MYNSRPRNYKGNFSVPENYSGNAFLDEEEKKLLRDSEETFTEEETEAEEVDSKIQGDAASEQENESEAVAVGSVSHGESRFGLNASRLFRGGIGFEEILIIALILLISQSDNNEDIIVLLALLLFVS